MDNLTKEQRKNNMKNIRSTNTTPERSIFRELRRRRIYFARHVSSIFGKPDILFRRKMIAIFIDSDFWHGHVNRGTMPKSNTKYWREKIHRNKERDKKVNRVLRKEGWKVIRIWEYDIKHNLDRCVNRILKAMNT